MRTVQDLSFGTEEIFPEHIKSLYSGIRGGTGWRVIIREGDYIQLHVLSLKPACNINLRAISPAICGQRSDVFRLRARCTVAAVARIIGVRKFWIEAEAGREGKLQETRVQWRKTGRVTCDRCL